MTRDSIHQPWESGLPLLELRAIAAQGAEGRGEALIQFARYIDSRDIYTYGHSERVARYAAAVARVMGFEPLEVERAREAGLLHDIGKVGVPAEVLQKPRSLDDEEYTLIQRHPDLGADVLEEFDSLAALAPIVRHHHERVDGGGYPLGLAGDDIPLLARLIAVIDAYDAMVSSRPYRDPLDIEDALIEIHEGAGSQFDPAVVAAFAEMIAELQPHSNSMFGASTMFAKLNIRDQEARVSQLARRHSGTDVSGIAARLAEDFPEIATRQATKIVRAVLDPATVPEDLLSFPDDVDWIKEDEVRVRYPTRIDPDIGQAVGFEGRLYTLLDIKILEDRRLEYHLKR